MISLRCLCLLVVTDSKNPQLACNSNVNDCWCVDLHTCVCFEQAAKFS